MQRVADTHDSAVLAEPRIGDTVVAQDGVLGRVDRIIRSEERTPAYLVIAARRRIRRTYPIVPSSFVTRVDRSRGQVHIRGRRSRLGELPETLPIVV